MQTLTPPSTVPIAHLGTLSEILGARAQRTPDAVAFTFVDERDRAVSMSYVQLDRRARAVAAELEARGLVGAPVLLGMPAGLDFVAGFFGTLYARSIAVPVALPRLGRAGDGERRRLVGILGSLHAGGFLTTRAVVPYLEAAVETCRLPALPDMIAVDDTAFDDIAVEHGDGFRPQVGRAEELAIIQFTSGSTSRPRGVVIRHSNVLSNLRMLAKAYRPDEATVIGGWLPHFHDMGLIGLVAQPVVLGVLGILMSPLTFLRRPVSWLKMIDRFGVTVSGGPSFAYELLARRVSNEDIATLDLSRWRVAFDGAEPVRADVHRRFAARFASTGFDASAFFPGYGLAEGTLFVSGGPADEPPRALRLDPAMLSRGFVHPATTSRSVELVSCGRIIAPARVRIVDPDSHEEVGPGRIGEIWVAGPHVASGYLMGGAQNRATFRNWLDREGPFLRTGDLGFVDREELFVTGRLKEVILVRGRTFHPHDLERTVARALSLSSARVAVVQDDRSAMHRGRVEEGPAGDGVFVALEGIGESVRPEILEMVRAAMFEEHGLFVDDVVMLTAKGIPRTSSGKKQRRALAHAVASGPLRAPADGSGPNVNTQGPGSAGESGLV